jgi:hypothetical protein
VAAGLIVPTTIKGGYGHGAVFGTSSSVSTRW